MSALVLHRVGLEHQEYLQKLLEADYHSLRGITQSRAFPTYGADERAALARSERLAFDLLMALPALSKLQAG